MNILSLSRFRRRSVSAPSSLKDLSEAIEYPVLDAAALIRLLGLGAKISSIRQLASLSPESFERLYIPAMDRFLEAAQLQPGSANDHHWGLGGLAIHTFDVVERAMMARRGLLLPRNAEPDRVNRESSDWTYGVFAGALLHDAGKLMALTRLLPNVPGQYSPLGQSLVESGATSYRFEFVDSDDARYEFQQRASVAMLCYLPAPALDRIARNLPLFSQLTAYLGNVEPYEWGLLGQICHTADLDSVRLDLAPGKPRGRLPGAPHKSLAERLIQAIRAEIADQGLPLNRNGGAGWIDGDTLWLVCKIAVGRARTRMHELGASDIPEDDLVIFKTLTDHDYAIPTREGNAVWYTRVRTAAYEYKLTMLRFDASRLVLSTRLRSFEGSVEVITEKEYHAHDTPRGTVEFHGQGDDPGARTAIQSADDDSGSPPPPHFADLASAAPGTDDHPYAPSGSSVVAGGTPDMSSDWPEAPDQASRTPVEPEPVADEPSLESPVGDQVTSAPLVPDARSPAGSDEIEAESESDQSFIRGLGIPGVNASREQGQTASSEPAAAPPSRRKPKGPPPPPPASPKAAAELLNRLGLQNPATVAHDPVPLTHPALGRYFLTWFRAALKAGDLSMDPSGKTYADALITTEGVAIVNPKVLNTFLGASGLETTERIAERRAAAETVRKSLGRSGHLVMRGKYAIHQVLLPTPRLSPTVNTLHCLIVPLWAVFDEDEIPDVNESITLRTGNYPMNDKLNNTASRY